MRRLLVAVLAVLLVGAAPARGADTFGVDTCATASGGPATFDGWKAGGMKSASPSFDCPGAGMTVRRAPVVTGSSSAFELLFEPPAGTRIAGLRVWRGLSFSEGWSYTLGADRVIETCAAPCSPRAAGALSGPPDVSASGLDTDLVVFSAQCPANACTSGQDSLLTVRRMQVDVTDDSDPTFTAAPSGDLLDTAHPLSGVRTLSFSAADQGSGVYAARIEIDGQTAAAATVDDNGGRCVKPFRDFTPCRASAAGSLSFDTSTLADGAHTVRLVVTDATETNAVAYGPVQVTTSNQSSTCAGPVVSPAVTARFALTPKPRLTRVGGKAFSLTGTAPAGAGLVLLSLDARTGATWAAAGSASAGADGRFRVAVPAGPSRSLRVAFRASSTARELDCSNVLEVRVPARVSMVAKRSAKRRYRLSGQLAGGFIPARGKLVELQAYERGKWRNFGSVRSTAGGRYAYTYKFNAESVGQRFRLRARVRSDSTYPFSLGYSKVIRVRVR